MYHHQNAGQNQNMMTANKTFENVEKFRYLGMTVTNQNDTPKEINNRLKMGLPTTIQFRIFVFPSAI
jgi:hypothetical protein